LRKKEEHKKRKERYIYNKKTTKRLFMITKALLVRVL
jgi:hypothetical protein